MYTQLGALVNANEALLRSRKTYRSLVPRLMIGVIPDEGAKSHNETPEYQHWK